MREENEHLHQTISGLKEDAKKAKGELMQAQKAVGEKAQLQRIVE